MDFINGEEQGEKYVGPGFSPDTGVYTFGKSAYRPGRFAAL
jgi:hypothetical protein